MSGNGAAWGAKRFKCSLPVAMAEIRECVDSAIERANELMSERRAQFAFALEGDSKAFKVSGWPLGPTVHQDNFKVVCFEMDADTGRILVKTVAGCPDFRVSQRWSVKDEKCSIYAEIDGEEPCEYTADQIAQLALERLFFI